jgi:hypothetical protein
VNIGYGTHVNIMNIKNNCSQVEHTKFGITMQFAQNYSNAERTRPSVFGQFTPSTFIGNDSSAGWLQVPPSQMPWGIPTADQPTIVR